MVRASPQRSRASNRNGGVGAWMQSMNRFSGSSGEYGRENDTSARNQDAGFRSSGPETEQVHTLSRVQIHLLVSGEVSCSRLGPDLADRLKHLCAASGKRLHSLQVEVVQMPIACPGCGHRALYRCQRKGFLQSRCYPVFGFYPWGCTCCRRTCLLRLRRPPAPAISIEEPAAEGRRAA
jgi:DNA-directed RNA polymerase subunit RPC12/RpoP